MATREYLGQLVRVIDGDTCVIRVELGFHISYEVDIRMLGINAPEHDTPAGQVSKAALEKLCGPPGTALRVLTDKTEKYGRWLGTIFLISPVGKSINTQMIEAGFAKPWDGRGVRPI